MANLIPDIDKLKKHVSIGFDFDYNVILPYINKAERQHIKALIGDTLYAAWTSEPSDAVEKSAYLLFQEAASNFAVFNYIPVGNVHVSDSGISVAASEHTKPAEWWQIKDIKRNLVEAANLAIDEALKIMESNPAKFTGWDASEGYTVFKELIVPKTQDFHRHFNISNSRRTFLALRAYQLETQNRIFNWLDATNLAQIKAGADEKDKHALDLAQAAQVNHTVATAAESGVFIFSATGMFSKSVLLPGDHNTKASQLTEQELYRLIQSRRTAGDEYLKKLKLYMVDNTADFNNYEAPTASTDVFVHNTKSIVTF